MDAEQQHEAPRTATARIPHGQLRLLNTSDHPEWQLDESTRAVGRRGVAQARAALRAARGDHADEAGRPGSRPVSPSPRSTAA